MWAVGTPVPLELAELVAAVVTVGSPRTSDLPCIVSFALVFRLVLVDVLRMLFAHFECFLLGKGVCDTVAARGGGGRGRPGEGVLSAAEGPAALPREALNARVFLVAFWIVADPRRKYCN